MYWKQGITSEATRKDKVQEIAEYVIDWLKEEKTEQNITSACDNKIDLILRGAPHLVITHYDATVIGNSQKIHQL